MAGVFKSRFPKLKAVLGDIQASIDFADGFFQRALAFHVSSTWLTCLAASQDMRDVLFAQRTAEISEALDGL